MARDYRALDGVLLFDKPLELSSNTALQKVRHLFQADKAGHTGTLDPLATGLLPVCFGEATKFSTALLDADKTYLAKARLGQVTSTGDAEGEVIASHEVTVDEAQVRAALLHFVGEIEQLPPMHSAIKFQGKPLYEYIRKGERVAREKRRVTIHALTLVSFSGDELEFSVRCSKGTYVRTLAEDIGAHLGCGAHLIGLRRTAIAGLSLDHAVSWAALQVMSPVERDSHILPVDTLLPEYPALQLDEVQTRRLAQGQQLTVDADLPEGKLRLYGAGRFIGVGNLKGGRLSPERLSASVAKSAANADLT
ncbi:tRNA pseudouridine(55) synthase TruB [Ferriphaselus sp. R-1]|uniref:tRNA pseudouridine(55) synthase TruB n=1 Tax=Ferriphaselus sp. R-1 TaxID=1485544 RepID=UPI000559122C|nr:tRNA pseudouridine(55) synthase TruB [Ferriphaselus sp. R-1]